MATHDTIKFKTMDILSKKEKKEILFYVHSALKEKGYDFNNQLIGYLISGDPTYITTFKDARNQIKKLDRDDILELLLDNYFEIEDD